ncbi:hypothetical protein Plec18167_001101 [Paecilomyces lecythidis]|uniref:DNA replication regulator Sld3 C-terminal domain-containing protein n=1 Tax=Paecilomyces lecythidis TaxID=3004212 RepID=A0ABR3YBC4_9EURO
MASRGSLNVLESTSLNALNKLYGPPPPFKKRKLSHDTRGGLRTSQFTIQAHDASPFGKSLTLESVVLLPRSRLPLSWLDVSWESPDVRAGQLFMANIPDLEDDLYGHKEPVVLVARFSHDSQLCIIERVKRGIYAVCGLARGVEEGDLFVAAKGWRRPDAATQEVRHEFSEDAGRGEWWEAAKVDDNAVFEFDSSAKGIMLDVSLVFDSGGENPADDDGLVDSQLSVSQSYDVFQDGRNQSFSDLAVLENSFTASQDVPTPPGEPEAGTQPILSTSFDDGGIMNVQESVQSAEELLDGLRNQYLDALYASKTSVAYFAKGPLTRCRTAFQPSKDDSFKLDDLISFYRDAILPVKKVDLKYRETLPATVNDIALSMSDDEGTSKTKKRKSKKKKLGKDGLYPEEHDFIKKWWTNRNVTEAATSVELTRDGEVKRRIADLRLRETQLQILLILETIALEAVGNAGSKDAPEKEADDGVKKTKSKKPQDLNVLLEILLDRLCIWHTVSFEEAVVADSAKTDEQSHLSGKKVESDILRDFCTEVIVPFYAARLPDQCKSIVRKLGGPSAVSPVRPTPQSKSSSKPQPGAAIKRPQPQKSRRTLQRVLTDEQAASQKRPPSLLRSSTAPSIQDAKRDSMEPLLPSIGGSVRGGIQKAKRVDNREVDLNAVAKQHEAKLKKMHKLIEQKKELNAAINALKKPNRELVAKDIAEAAERRVSSGSARKPKNPVRNPLGQGVQVMATPKGSRKKDMTSGLPQPRGFVRSSVKHNQSSPFSSQVSVVPGSAIRPSHASGAAELNESTPKVTQKDDDGIQETPSRGMSKLSNPLVAMVKEGCDSRPNSKYSGNLFRVPTLPPPRSVMDAEPTTPLPSRQSNTRTLFEELPYGGTPPAIQETPPRQSMQIPVLEDVAPSSPAPVLDTPVKSGLRRPIVDPPNVPVTPEKSIYTHLGWDDDELAF